MEVVSGLSRTTIARTVACAIIVAALVTRAQTAGSQLHICHAGSLFAAFTRVEDEFKARHPNVTIVDTSGGSVDLVRRFAAGRLECDVIAPADHLVIEMMLKPARLADYTIVFARGRMVLGYMASDPRASAITVSGSFNPPASIPQVTGKWYDALTAPGARIAGAHPFLDPGGYRAHLIFELAEAHTKVPGLYNALLQHYQVNVADPAGPAPALGKDFSFQFTYEHTAAATAARDASYRYARLPEEIDLSSTKVRYAASVTIPGLGVSGTGAAVTIPASVTEWGVTIATNSRNREVAAEFLASLLGPTGRAALTRNGPAPRVPAHVSREDHQRLPGTLRSLVTTE